MEEKNLGVITDPVEGPIPKKRNFKPLIITASIIATIGLAGATTWVVINRQSTLSDSSTTSKTSDSSTVSKTSDGDQKITKGGAYTFTGTISGRIVIDTDQEVTITLKDATLTCSSDQAAIKSKSTGKVTIVLEGEN